MANQNISVVNRPPSRLRYEGRNRPGITGISGINVFGGGQTEPRPTLPLAPFDENNVAPMPRMPLAPVGEGSLELLPGMTSVVPKPRFSPIRNPYQEKGAASSYGYEDERGNWVDVLDGNREPIVGGKRIPTSREQVKGVMDLPDEKSKAFSRIHEAYSTGADFGYESGWPERLNVPEEYIGLYMAVPDAAKKYAYENPTDAVLEQFEEKYGFPLNISIPL
tara:strand:- start:3022 stop:3684 length:663 start_codon:yes stop_codon:yes gene_type:complete